jgi:hypothetical protein
VAGGLVHAAVVQVLTTLLRKSVEQGNEAAQENLESLSK